MYRHLVQTVDLKKDVFGTVLEVQNPSTEFPVGVANPLTLIWTWLKAIWIALILHHEIITGKRQKNILV